MFEALYKDRQKYLHFKNLLLLQRSFEIFKTFSTWEVPIRQLGNMLSVLSQLFLLLFQLCDTKIFKYNEK